MIPTNIRRADELKWRDDVLKRVSQNQCRCQQQPQSQKMPQSALSTNNPSPPPAYTASVPRNQKQVYNPPNNTSQKFGNCLAVRKGPFISISGLTPSPSSSNNAAQQQQQQQLHLSNASAQAMQAMRQGIQSVKELGGKGAEDVIRVKISIAVSSMPYLLVLGCISTNLC